MNLKPALSSSLCVKAVGSLTNVWTNCCCILLKKLISWIYPLILWVEDRDLREHSQQRTAGQPVLLFDCWFTLECVCQNLHVLPPRWNPTLQSSISTTCLIYVLHRQLMIYFFSPPHPSLFSHPALMPIFPLIFLFSLFTTHLFQPCHLSHYSPHSSLPLLSPLSSSLLPLHVISFISSFSLLIYLFTSSLPLPPPPLPLRLSGRLLIAVSQYHGGRQRGCRSGGECSTRTAGSHSHVQPWHPGQVRAQDKAAAHPREDTTLHCPILH